MGKNKGKLILSLIFVFISLYYLYPTLKLYSFSEKEIKQMEMENPTKLNRLKAKAIRRGLDLQGGVHLVMKADLSDVPPGQEDNAVKSALEVIRNRVDEFGVTEPVIQRQGQKRIVVELPGLEDIERAKDLIGKTALLEFKLLKSTDELRNTLKKIDQKLAAQSADTTQPGEIEAVFQEEKVQKGKPFTSLLTKSGEHIAVPGNNINKVKAILNSPKIKEIIPPDAQFLWGNELEGPPGNKVRRLFYVKSVPEMTGSAVSTARATIGGGRYAGQPIVEFNTTDEGAGTFARITGANVGRRLAIVLDNKVYSAPVIRNKIRNGRSIITGSESLEEARDLAIVLRTGALPAPLNVVEERRVGPSLGADSINKGFTAGIIGLIVLVCFLVAYYRLSGLVILLAVFLDLMFILAVLAGFGATLTLPGIAGLILTIGMSVDANVLIFERIREELKGGKTVRTAIDIGYSRAFRTILDANVTTLIAAVVLYYFGTGPIRGFALVLSIGIIGSMFAALIITKITLDFISAKTGKLSLGKGLFTDAKFRFLDARKVAFLISASVIILGFVGLGIHKGPKLGTDFTGGTMLEVHFDPPVAIEKIRSALSEVNVDGRVVDLSNTEIKKFGSPNDVLIKTGEFAGGTSLADGVKERLKQTFAGNLSGDQEKWLRRQVKVGPEIGSELRGKALKAIIIALVLMLIYISWRFEFKFAVASIVALFHDVLITTGAFFLLDKEFSLVIVAALLTIVGYSLNDTIVVFDRIREGLGIFRRLKYSELVNRCINDVLSRTVVTSLTTFLVVLALFLLGGEVIHNFSFALLVGVLVGTYSSIFIASPILVVWQGKSKLRQRKHR